VTIGPDPFLLSQTTARYQLAFNENTGTNIAELNGGNPATLQTGGTWVAGHTGTAIVSVTAATAAAIANTSALATGSWLGVTIMMWVKHNSAANDDLIAGFSDAIHTSESFGFSLPTNGIKAWIVNNADVTSETPVYTHGWTNGTWHHIAVTWSVASGTVTLWTDGTLRTTIALAGAALLTTATVELGNTYWNSTTTGVAIDDFRMYDGELNSAAITTASTTPVA
jgi:hypothetical protein